MRVYRDIYNAQGQFVRTDVVFDIMEAMYTGQDMGKRSIMATIKYATPIDFQMGDYVEFAMQSLVRDPGHNRGEVMSPAERFYIYTEPQCKKTARPMSAGDAFETTVTFYPRQYELAGIQMRDFVQQEANAETLIYTGFDNVSFYGGAKELLDRCMACLKQYYKDSQGNPLWSYVLADALNEDKNNALERYAFSFSGNSVMDALMKLNDKDYINTTFFINGRTIYVGFKRPFLCSVNAAGAITDTPLDMMYGKTSHLPIDKTYGGLYDITKSVGEELPITKLFAYGAARNLNRYYCADRIQSGRFVNKLMLPSFSDDGTTDWIISEEAVKKYGIREGSKTFEEVYPSLRYMTYADIRGIKYCIKVRYSGLSGDVFEEDGKMTHKNSNSAYPVARVQCYQVVPCTGIEDQQTGEKDGTVGCNKLVECQPPEDLAVFIHATGKTVKVLLYGGATKAEACQKQLAHDGKIPTTDGNAPAADWSNCYAGACFAVHDIGFVDMNGQTYDATERANWFTAPFLRTLEYDPTYTPGTAQERAELHRIEYVDTFWLTDLYVMEYENGAAKYDAQRSFKRDGYSAWAWPRLNDQSNFPGSLPVNEVVAVEPVTIPDTSDNINGGRQQHWDIYLRDLGFAIDEQNDFGELVFVFSTPVVSVLDGILAGREFTIDGGENLNDFQERVMCAYDENGNFNQDFLMPGDSMDTSIAQRAYLNGAVWRIRLNRNDNDSELSSIGLVIPNTDIHMKGGDHVVLLDIYMPDIYVRAAEQRLLREAKAYLDKNDRGNVKYSINFDKVRFNQIQNYSRQMREGLMLRMVDEDLNISSDNKVRDIVKHTVPLETQVPFYIINSQTGSRQQETKYTWESYTFRNVMTYNESQERLTIKIPRSTKTAEFVKVVVHGNQTTYGTTPANQNAYAYDDETWIITFDCDYPLYSTLLHSYRTYVKITELLYERTDSKVYPSEGALIPAISKDYVSFKSGKYYEVVMQVQDDYWDSEEDGIVLSVSPIDTETRYTIDEYECEATSAVDGWRTVTYKFHLPDSFNDMQGYYIALNYIAPDNSGSDKIDYGAIRIVKVTEKDLNSQGQAVKYVDFKIAQVTIKIQDNTRPADQRIKGVYPEPIYEIQATIEEQTKASTWGSLMNDVEKTRIESEETKRTYEMLANIARQNYQQLLNLKNNIFDPDGTCNDVFIQTMMLQVGADSMNYQLDRTFTTPTGVRSNFDVSGRDVQGGTYDKFVVYDDDVLHHFVYTQGAQGGTWCVRGSFEAVLSPTTGENNETIWPTYFVCIKCRKDTDNDPTEVTWICSTKQYAVNDDSDTNYWYFNWGILTADSDGFYSLMETRGNAYMYGDNLICGKISTLAYNSYFDLTHGNFVLSKYGPDGNNQYHEGLTYIDGVLTIYGINDGSETSILTRLGLTEGVANGAATAAANAAAAAAAAQAAADAAQAAVDKVTNDGIISKGTEKQELNREFIIIAGDNRDGEGTDGSYYINKSKADEYGVDHTALDDAFEDLYAAMKVVLGTSQSTGKIDGSKIQQDTYIGGLKNGTATYDIRQPYGDNMYVGDNQLVLYDGKYYTGIIPEYDKAYMLSIKRVEGYAYALAVIKKTGESTSEDIAMLISRESGDPSVYTNIKQNITHVSEELGFRCGTNGGGQSFELTGINFRPWTNIGVNEFNALWKNYYDAEVELLNRISNAIDEREIGGENMIETMGRDYLSTGTYAGYGFLNIAFKNRNYMGNYDSFPIGKYVFSAESIWVLKTSGGYPPTGVEVKIVDSASRTGYNVIAELGTGDNIVSRFELTEAKPLFIRVIYNEIVEASVTILGAMLQIGTKKTAYQDYIKHLTDALHGTTEVIGGLTMTNLLMLKDENDQVKAGMSGLTDNNPSGTFGDGTYSEGVAMFAGGTYQEALLQAKGLYAQLSTLLPVLITKTGIHSKIGPFEVISETAVAVKSTSGTIIIDTNKGISMLDANGAEKFSLVPEEIDLSGITSYRGIFSFESQLQYLSPGTSDTGVVLYLGHLDGAGIPTTGSYKVIANNFAAWVRAYWRQTKHLPKHATPTITTGLITDTIPFSYVIYLQNDSTGNQYLLTGSDVSTNIDSYALLGISSEKTFSSLPAGQYSVYIRFGSSYDFSGYQQHYYDFMVRNGEIEIVGMDGTDYSGKVVIGTNGLLVTAGSSTYMMVKTIQSTNKLDVRMSGLPSAGDGSTIVPGQLYRYNGDLKVAL